MSSSLRIGGTLALPAVAVAALLLGGCSGPVTAGSHASSRSTTTTTEALAPTTTSLAPATTTSTPGPAQMEAWVVEAKLPLTTLIAHVGTLTAELQAVNEVGNPSSAQFLASNSCGSLAAVESTAARVRAPMTTIESDWGAVLSTYAAIATACSSAVAAGTAESAFYARLTTLESPFKSAVVTLTTDLAKAGYCFPSDTCLPPYRVVP